MPILKPSRPHLRPLRALSALAAATTLLHCITPPDPGDQDAGQPPVETKDAGAKNPGVDAGQDAGIPDAGRPDAGPQDAGRPDRPDASVSTGTAVPALQPIEDATKAFMNRNGIASGTLAVIRDGNIVLSRGYGWATDQAPIQPDAAMRIASLSKPITAAAIRKLITANQLSLSTPVFPLLNVPPLDAGVKDPRLDSITVQHLLMHQGGWDNNVAGFEPMTSNRSISGYLNLPRPATKQEVLRYMVGQPLQYAPGSQTVYSNFGYSVLGAVLEKVTGQSYLQYTKAQVLTPLGATRVWLASTTTPAAEEPWYDDPNQCLTVLLPRTQQRVNCAYGGYWLDAMDAHGGLVMTAPDLARFANQYTAYGEPRAPGWTGAMYGGLPGTLGVMYWRPDNRTQIVALFTRAWTTPPGYFPDAFDFHNQLETAAAQVTNWP